MMLSVNKGILTIIVIIASVLRAQLGISKRKT